MRRSRPDQLDVLGVAAIVAGLVMGAVMWLTRPPIVDQVRDPGRPQVVGFTIDVEAVEAVQP